MAIEVESISVFYLQNPQQLNSKYQKVKGIQLIMKVHLIVVKEKH